MPSVIATNPRNKPMTLDELKTLAEAAIPRGPWRYIPWHVEEGPATVRQNNYGIVAGNFASDDTAKYVAAISPDRVLAMLAVIEAAKAMRTPALVENRDRVADFDAALATLEEA